MEMKFGFVENKRQTTNETGYIVKLRLTVFITIQKRFVRTQNLFFKFWVGYSRGCLRGSMTSITVKKRN